MTLRDPRRPAVSPAGLSLLALAASLAAQGPTPKAAVDAFVGQHGSDWLVRWNEPTGTPRALFGSGLVLADWRENTLEEARRHAQKAIAEHGELLGTGVSEFRESIGARMGRTWTFAFDQWFHGLPVVGGRLDVRVHGGGKLVHLGSTAWPVPQDFGTVPVLGEEEATLRAWAASRIEPQTVPQPGKPRAPRLVIWGDEQGPREKALHLAWEIQLRAVDAQGNGPIGRAFVDAKDGALLQFVSDKHECGFAGCGGGANGEPMEGEPVEGGPAAKAPPVPTTFTVRGWTHTAFSPVSTPTNAVLPGVEVQVPGVGTFVTDANGQFTADLTSSVQVTARLDGEHTSLVTGTGAPTSTRTLQPGTPATFTFGTSGSGEALLAHTTTYYWTDRVNRFARSVLGNSPQLAIADSVVPTVNIASTCNAYYSGNSINFYASGGGCNNTSGASVVAHEWGHGLDDLYGGISQVNGLSEGWGDVCSQYLLDDPTIGHDFFAGGGGIRTGTNTQQYPNGSGPHDQGLSWMGFAWKFRQNLRASLGTAQAVQISNDVVLASIVAAANNQADAVVAAFQADDDDGNLANGTPNHAALANACTQHSLPFPAIQAGALTHASIGTTTSQLEPRRVEAVATPYTGAFTQVRLHWNDGVARQRDMVPTGVQDRWHALLPGQLAPLSQTYHIEAVHQNGVVLRMPAVGEYLVTTRAERRIWREDFETGGAGWTHGAVTGIDEWQIGAPAGKSGFGWSDPAAAFSGSQCAGTDLGQASDGLYTAPSETWLRSPPIDCTGMTGVRLRFRRWLSVVAPSDFADLRINGGLVWQSSFTVTSESGWSTFDLPVSAATNHPGVVVEFRLRSNGAVAFGGWNLDDVELYTLDQAVPVPVRMALSPDQARTGSPLSLQVTTPPSQIFLVVLGDTPGPSLFPGVPPILAGGSLFTVFGITDASGNWSGSFTTPFAPPTGVQLWGQTITQDSSGAFAMSNAWRNLFVP